MKKKNKRKNEDELILEREEAELDSYDDSAADETYERYAEDTEEADDLAVPTSGGYKLLTYLTALLFVGGFALYAALSKRTAPLPLAAAGISLLFFAILIIKLIPRLYLGFDVKEKLQFGERSRKKLHPIFRTVLLSLIMQLGIVTLCYALGIAINGMEGTLPEMYQKMFIYSDGMLFGANTARLMAVMGAGSFFMPLDLYELTANSTFVIALIAFNSIAICASSVFIYELMITDDVKKVAKSSVILLHLLPSVLLMLQPLSGTAPFFAFALLSVLLARRGRPVWAGIAALIACMFNIIGVLLIVPIMIEGIIAVRGCKNSDEELEDKSARRVRGGAVAFGAFLPLLAPIMVAVLTYMRYAGMTVIKQRPILFFETFGRLIAEWNGEGIGRTMVILSVCVIALVWMLLYVCCIGRTRSSYTLYSVLSLALLPSVLTADLSIYASLACPFIAALLATRCRWRPLRVGTSIALIVILVLVIVFLFIKRI